MGPHLIVVLDPVVDQMLCVTKSIEDIHIQALVSQSTVKAFYKPIFTRATSCDEVQVQFQIMRPFVENHSREFRAVVQSDCRWKATRLYGYAVKNIDNL